MRFNYYGIQKIKRVVYESVSYLVQESIQWPDIWHYILMGYYYAETKLA